MNGIDEIRAVVAQHRFPSFVHALRIEFGEYDGDPAVWLTFTTDTLSGLSQPSLMERAEALSRFRQEVFVDLMRHSVEPYPFFRFEDVVNANPHH